MNKIKALNILRKSGHKNIVEVSMQPGEYLDKHSHDWNVDIIIIEGSLQINFQKKVKVLLAGERFRLKKNVQHTEHSGVEGVFFLSARPNK